MLILLFKFFFDSRKGRPYQTFSGYYTTHATVDIYNMHVRSGPPIRKVAYLSVAAADGVLFFGFYLLINDF